MHSTLPGSQSSKPELVPAEPAPCPPVPVEPVPAKPAPCPPVLVLPATALDSPAALPPTLEPALSAPALPTDPPSSPLLPQATARQSRVLQTREPIADARMAKVYTNQATSALEWRHSRGHARGQLRRERDSNPRSGCPHRPANDWSHLSAWRPAGIRQPSLHRDSTVFTQYYYLGERCLRVRGVPGRHRKSRCDKS